MLGLELRPGKGCDDHSDIPASESLHSLRLKHLSCTTCLTEPGGTPPFVQKADTSTPLLLSAAYRAGGGVGPPFLRDLINC